MEYIVIGIIGLFFLAKAIAGIFIIIGIITGNLFS
jgi:hypothetical protein